MVALTPRAALLGVVGLSSAALLLASAVHAQSAPPAPLEIAVEDGADVWSRPDGSGYANDVVRAAFQAMGVTVHLQVVPYARCKAMVVRGIVPSCFSMSRHPSIPAWIRFSDRPLFTFNSDFFQNVRRPLPARKMRGLRRGTVVGVVLGYEYPPAIYEMQRRGVLVLEEGADEAINLRKLADGRLDAALVNSNETKTAADLLESVGVTGQVERAFAGGVLPAYIGFNSRHPQGLEALARFNAGRRAIAANGILAEIGRRWADTVRVSRGARDRRPVQPIRGPS